jgi:hypothetical protein
MTDTMVPNNHHFRGTTKMVRNAKGDTHAKN